MDFNDLIGEIFLILLFLGLALGVILVDKIRRKR
jgi:hypothetical protein